MDVETGIVEPVTPQSRTIPLPSFGTSAVSDYYCLLRPPTPFARGMSRSHFITPRPSSPTPPSTMDTTPRGSPSSSRSSTPRPSSLSRIPERASSPRSSSSMAQHGVDRESSPTPVDGGTPPGTYYANYEVQCFTTFSDAQGSVAARQSMIPRSIPRSSTPAPLSMQQGAHHRMERRLPGPGGTRRPRPTGSPASSPKRVTFDKTAKAEDGNKRLLRVASEVRYRMPPPPGLESDD